MIGTFFTLSVMSAGLPSAVDSNSWCRGTYCPSLIAAMSWVVPLWAVHSKVAVISEFSALKLMVWLFASVKRSGYSGTGSEMWPFPDIFFNFPLYACPLISCKPATKGLSSAKSKSRRISPVPKTTVAVYFLPISALYTALPTSSVSTGVPGSMLLT
ncbi:hypothetical protein Tfer_3297 [Thermincola ferriacetica]|uniref:Uncharacterized protein n=1 Tax=Thermincola ferriacetica TaxID=281456 RepID=A0A0L6VYE0_9FIRM|nr:hypothetical protein Tfer_3297 [Thermincola ferriacetica]